MNALDIDPKNLAFDFKRDWMLFSESRVKKFLVAWLQKELRDARCALENVEPDDLGLVQGNVSRIKKMLNLVERPYCPEEALKEVLAYLEKEK